MSINISNYELALAKKINQEALTTEDALLYAQAIKKSQVGTVFTVTNFNDLPSGTTVPVGSIYYVENDVRHYVYDSIRWRLLNNDLNKSVWAWGCNGFGQLGDGTTVIKSSPVSIIGGFTDWCQISVGTCHAHAIRDNGTAWSWGYNGGGALGDGTTTNKSSPVSVIGGFTDWCQISGGQSSLATQHSLGIRTNGTLWAWGCGNYGKLGNNCTAAFSSPVSVVGGYTDWRYVSAANNHVLALRSDNTAWAWGRNQDGQLGDGTTTNRSSPVSVIGGYTWCLIAGGHNTLAVGIRNNGTLWAWGRNDEGDIGDGTTVKKSSPVSVLGGFTDWCYVESGQNFSAAIRTNGTIWTWGRNTCGELGDGTTTNKSSPVSVIGGFTNWCQVSAGNSFGAAVRTDGTLWAWGENLCGKLGNGETSNTLSPVSVIGGFTDWSQVCAGNNSTIALRY